MINIKPQKIKTYNELIRSNKFLSRRLDKTDDLPIGKLEILIEPMCGTTFHNLIELSGGKNAAYLTKCIYDFYKDWILFTNKIESTKSFKEKNNKDYLIKSISNCFEPHIIHFEPKDFFKELEKKPFFESIEHVGCLKEYGLIKLNNNNLYAPKKIELSLLGNCITLKDY